MDEGRERIPSGGDLSGLARDFLARIGQIGEDPGQLVPLAESAIEEGPQDPDRRIEQRGGPVSSTGSEWLAPVNPISRSITNERSAGCSTASAILRVAARPNQTRSE